MLRLKASLRYICHQLFYLTHLVFTVTNNLSYDQRMQRICTSLANARYDVTLIGRAMPLSLPLQKFVFNQKRLPCYFSKGKLMYAEFNLRLFFYLLFIKADVLCAIDLDTILPNYFASVIKKTRRVYDAHELFTEQKEIVTRPAVKKMWSAVERFAVPRFAKGYTVNNFIRNQLKAKYGVQYAVVRNLPLLTLNIDREKTQPPFVIYQGAVNEGRSFETLIPAMKTVKARLVICGNGNFFEQAKQLIKQHEVEGKVELRGYIEPHELALLTPTAYCAVMLFENTGLNQYHSLANRFFDYIMAGLPQVCVAYPEYKAINDEFDVAYLIEDTRAETIAAALNNLLSDSVVYDKLRDNCLQARKVFNWQNEEKVLLDFYARLVNEPV